MIEKRLKSTASSYNHSHQKNAKNEVKYLTRSSVPDTIFSNKQQATSNKQQATSNKQQAFKTNRPPAGQNSGFEGGFLYAGVSYKLLLITGFTKPASIIS